MVPEQIHSTVARKIQQQECEAGSCLSFTLRKKVGEGVRERGRDGEKREKMGSGSDFKPQNLHPMRLCQ